MISGETHGDEFPGAHPLFFVNTFFADPIPQDLIDFPRHVHIFDRVVPQHRDPSPSKPPALPQDVVG